MVVDTAVAAAALAVAPPVATLLTTLLTGRGRRRFLLEWDDGMNYYDHDLLRQCEGRESGVDGVDGGVGGVISAATAAWDVEGGTVLGVFEPVALSVKCCW